ncbi:MAG: DUF6326 family protein [Pleomorphochaeta sp.]
MSKKKCLLFALWVSVLINMIYADILSLMDASSPIRSIMAGTSSVPAGGLLVGAILMESAIVMIILSLFADKKFYKWVNLVIAIVNILAVISGGHGAYYIFFAIIEVITLLAIMVIAFVDLKFN